MSVFRYRNLMANLGQAQNPGAVLGFCDFVSGCGFSCGFNSGCGNFPNTCHVLTCFLGTRICGIPSCNFSGPIGCRFSFFQAQDPGDVITLAQLKSDLLEAIREIEELEKKKDIGQVDAALKEIDAAAEELKGLRAEVAKRKKKS